MESAVFKKVPTKLNYVGKMVLLFGGNEQDSTNCANHAISPKETSAATDVDDKRYKVKATVISTTKNESHSENSKNTAIEEDRNWEKESGQQLKLTKENKPIGKVSESFGNDASFSAYSNNRNHPEYVEFKKENRQQETRNQFEGTHHQVPALKSINRDPNADDLTFCRRVEITSTLSGPIVSTVPCVHNSCFGVQNLEKVLTVNETHIDVSIKSKEKSEKNRLSVNNLEESSTGILTEEYRTSLLEQIERDLDRMRQDGFLDDKENFTCPHLVNDNTVITTYVSRKRMRDSAISSYDRSTKYSSTTSTLSYSLEDYDEGIGMKKYVDVSVNTEREHLLNEKGVDKSGIEENVRENNREVSTRNGPSSPTSKRLSYIVEEIKSTERKYVEDLMKIVRDFLPYMLLQPIKFMEVQAIDDLFACIKDILRHQMDFLTAIENFQDIDSIVGTLISNNRLLCMYPDYFRNKPKTDEFLDNFKEIFKDMQEKFGDVFDLSAYLLIPMQRLGKYKLFLEKIEKEQKKLNISHNQTLIALELVKGQMSRGNTFIAIDSIKDSPLGESDENYGSFVDREKFDKSKYMVFLFEKVVVFTTIDQTNSEVFHYHDSIKMEDLNITTLDNFTIILNDSKKSKCVRDSKKYGYILEARTEKIWMHWKDNLTFYYVNTLKGTMANCDSEVYKWVWNCQ